MINGSGSVLNTNNTMNVLANQALTGANQAGNTDGNNNQPNQVQGATSGSSSESSNLLISEEARQLNAAATTQPQIVQPSPSEEENPLQASALDTRNEQVEGESQQQQTNGAQQGGSQVQAPGSQMSQQYGGGVSNASIQAGMSFIMAG